MDGNLDIIRTAVGGLFQPTRTSCLIPPYTVIHCRPNVHPAHAYPYTNTNAYANTFPYIHSGNSWLSQAAGGLHTD